MMDYINELLKVIQSNPIAASIFGASTVAGLFVWARNIPMQLFDFIINRITKTLTLDNSQHGYIINILETYIEKIYYAPKNDFSLSDDLNSKNQNGSADKLTIGENSTFYCKLNGKICKISKYIAGQNTRNFTMGAIGHGRNSTDRQVYNFTIMTLRNITLLNWYTEIRSIHDRNLKKRDHLLCILDENRATCEKPLINFDKLILPKSTKSLVDTIINNLESNNTFYRERNIPHKEGILLYGSPGCGKSLFIQGIASKYGYVIQYINLNQVDENGLLNIFTTEMEKVIFLIEDIDCQINTSINRNAQIKSENSGVSLALLLNILDGILTKSKQFVIVTTNNIDALDPALIRDGRFNSRIEFKPFTSDLILEYLKMFYGENLCSLREEQIKSLLNKYPEATITPAKLASICIRHKQGLNNEAVSELKQHLKTTIMLQKEGNNNG